MPGCWAPLRSPSPRPPAPRSRSSAIHGQDVSSHQESIDWSAQSSAGSHFAYVKATEGETWVSPAFSEQYTGAGAGHARGGYHFARPDSGDVSIQPMIYTNRHWWNAQVGDWTPTSTLLHIADDNGDDPSELLPGRW